MAGCLDGVVMAKDQKGKGALEIIEEAVHILRGNPLGLLPLYFIGSLPFVLALLYFWADMSRSAFAGGYCMTASLSLAALFVWMKCWHAAFCRKVTDYINHRTSPPWSVKQALRLASSQSVLSSTGIIVLPLAAIVAIPFGWAYAFYQNLSIEDTGAQVPLMDVFSRSRRLARLWPGQNHVILLVVSVFSLFVFLNLGVTVYMIPILLKRLLGIETLFTLSGHNTLNTTFLLSVCGLTYLCVDPLIKTIYCLRCFYGASIRTGRDLATGLIRSDGFRRGLSYVFILGLFSSALMGGVAHGASDEGVRSFPEESYVVSPEELDSSIEDVMGQREFIWRMPRDIMEGQEESGPVAGFIYWTLERVRDLGTFIAKWSDRLRDWLKNMFPDAEHAGTNKRGWLDAAHLLLYSILVVLVCILAVILWRLFQGQKRPRIKASGEVAPSAPDLSDDYVNPVELPAERWLNMARDLMQRQSLRLALRAFYLSTLAHLAEKNMITIAKYKSNMDYMGELKRRAHEHEELLSLFSMNLQAFDRAWYGMHEVTRNILDGFIVNQERMAAIVQG